MFKTNNSLQTTKNLKKALTLMTIMALDSIVKPFDNQQALRNKVELGCRVL